MWDNYVIVSGINGQPETYKPALLLNSLGIEAIHVYNGFKFEDGEEKDTKKILRKTHRKNQKPNDAVLRNMSKTCDFCDCMREKLLMDRLLLGDNRIRQVLIQQQDLKKRALAVERKTMCKSSRKVQC